MSTLRLKRYFLEEPNVDVTKRDYTIIGLIKESPKYDRGRKISTSYFVGRDHLEIVVRKVFTDIIRDGSLQELKIDHQFYDENNEIAEVNTTYVPLNIAEVATMERKRRERAIDYLRASSVGTPIENYVQQLLKYYTDEISLYVQGGSDEFKNAVQNETNQTIVSLLSIVVNPSTGQTVKDSILYQINF